MRVVELHWFWGTKREEREMEGSDEGVERVVDSKDLQQQSKAFDKLTDRVEDRQLDSSRVQEVPLSILSQTLLRYFTTTV